MLWKLSYVCYIAQKVRRITPPKKLKATDDSYLKTYGLANGPPYGYVKSLKTAPTEVII